MSERTEAKLVKAVETLASKITDDVKPDDALKYTQAALNAAHAIYFMSQESSYTWTAH